MKTPARIHTKSLHSIGGNIVITASDEKTLRNLQKQLQNSLNTFINHLNDEGFWCDLQLETK